MPETIVAEKLTLEASNFIVNTLKAEFEVRRIAGVDIIVRDSHMGFTVLLQTVQSNNLHPTLNPPNQPKCG